MTTNVIFFTSGMIPTSGEATNIAQLSAAGHPYPGFTTNIQNGAEITSTSNDYAPVSGATLVGAIPTIYSGGSIYTSSTVGAVLGAYATTLVANSVPHGAVVTSGQVLSTGVTGSGSSHVTLVVSGGIVTGATIA